MAKVPWNCRKDCRTQRKSSMGREFNDIIYADFKSVFGHKVGEIPEGKKNRVWRYGLRRRWKIYATQVLERLLSLLICIIGIPKITKTYNQKYLVEDDLKLQNNVLLVPLVPYYLPPLPRAGYSIYVRGILHQYYLHKNSTCASVLIGFFISSVKVFSSLTHVLKESS